MKIAFWLGFVATFLTFSSSHVNAQTEPLNVEMANSAWAMLNEERYEDAIQAADLCVVTFENEANRIQDNLTDEAIPVPIPSEIKLESEREEIFSRGLLNDVAACYYIKLAAAAALAESAEDICETYRSLSRYTHALVWDLRGWFWSPVTAAPNELRKAGIGPEDC